MSDMQNGRRSVMLVLGGTLLGSLLYIFSLSMQNQILLTVDYLIALFLYICSFYICSFLASYQQFKKSSQYIFLYIMVMIVIIAVICTYSFFMSL